MISIIVPTYNESGNIEELVKSIDKALGGKFEIIFIDDGSSDSSLNVIKDLSSKSKYIKYLSFSRNFGHQAALRAGLRFATGDAVISMDADLQHPPEMLPELIAKWEDGYEIVYTIRRDGQNIGLGKRLSSKLFYKLLNFLSGLRMEEGAADFRLMDRKVVDVVNSQEESDIFLRGYINWIGFKQTGIEYVPAERFSGSSKYTLKKMISLASHGVTQFSIKPLRLAHILAALAFCLSVAYIVYAIIMAATGNTISGWLSIVILLVFLQGVQFMLLGMIGEYLGRTFIQTKHRPEYIVAETNCKSNV